MKKRISLLLALALMANAVHVRADDDEFEETKTEVTKKGDREMKANNNQKAIDLLNKLLADEYTLYTKTVNYHWNVFGKHFGALHAFFKAQYEALFTFTDDVAERVRALQGTPFATLAEFSGATQLKEKAGDVPDDLGMIANLLKDHEAVIASLEKSIDVLLGLNDQVTANFLMNLAEKHEKMAWMLRAFLQK